MRKLLLLLPCILMCTHIIAQPIASALTNMKVICVDSTVRTWGYNTSGELGNGTTSSSSLPVTAIGLTGVKAVNGQAIFNVALKHDGTVWAWGYNPNGQLGLGYKSPAGCRCVPYPSQVTTLSGITAIAAGESRTLALKEDDTVYQWGYLNGSYVDTPRLVPSFGDVMAVATGTSHFLALRNDSTVWGWGEAAYGQLGDSTTNTRSTPGKAMVLTGVQAIAAAGYSSLALKSDGTVWQWGEAQAGTGHRIPFQLPGMSNVKAIAISWSHILVLKYDSTVWGYGHNSYGELGMPPYSTADTLWHQLSGLSSITHINAGESTSMARKADGSLYTWGYNERGQLGLGYKTTTGCLCVSTPNKVNGLCEIITRAKEEEKNSMLSVFPNPAKDIVTVEMKLNSKGKVTILLTDMPGRVIYKSIRNSVAQLTEQINCSGFSKGLYQLQVIAEERAYTRKILIE